MSAPALAAMTTAPAGVRSAAIDCDPDSGGSYSWEASVGGTNTVNGNKLTSIPLVGWTARGGMSVSLSLYHSSEGSGLSELGNKWSHSYDIYLIKNPDTGNLTVHHGDGLAYAFKKNSDGSYSAPVGVYDQAALTTTAGGSAYTVTTKNGIKYLFTSPIGNRWRCASITDRNGNGLSLSHNASGFVTAVSDGSGRTLTFSYNTDNQLTSITDPLGRAFLFSYEVSGGDELELGGTSGGFHLKQVTFPAESSGGATPTVLLGYDANECITGYTDPRGKLWTYGYSSTGALL